MGKDNNIIKRKPHMKFEFTFGGKQLLFLVVLAGIFVGISYASAGWPDVGHDWNDIQYGEYFIDSAGTSGQVWKSDGSGRGVWGTDTNTWRPKNTDNALQAADGDPSNVVNVDNDGNVGIGAQDYPDVMGRVMIISDHEENYGEDEYGDPLRLYDLWITDNHDESRGGIFVNIQGSSERDERVGIECYVGEFYDTDTTDIGGKFWGADYALLANGKVGFVETWAFEPIAQVEISQCAAGDDKNIFMISGHKQTDHGNILTVNATGLVGLGTSNPTQKLDVRGNAYVSGNICADSVITGACSTGSGDAFKVGNDAYLTDINIADTIAVKGAFNASMGIIKLGTGCAGGGCYGYVKGGEYGGAAALSDRSGDNYVSFDWTGNHLDFYVDTTRVNTLGSTTVEGTLGFVGGEGPFCIFSKSCPDGWKDKGHGGYIYKNSDGSCPYEKGDAFNDEWTWCHPHICCNA